MIRPSQPSPGLGSRGTAPLIALDFTGDFTGPTGGGLYRYGIQLIRGLAKIPSGEKFLVIGSGPEPVKEIQSLFQDQAANWRYIQFRHLAGRGAYYINHARLSILLLRKRVSLLHSLAYFIPLGAPCPVVATVHDLMYELFPEYSGMARTRDWTNYRWAVKHLSRRIVCDSQATATDLQRLWKVDRSRIDVVHLACDLQRNDVPAAGSGCQENNAAHVLLSPYNLEPRKNLETLLRAFAALRDGRPGLRLLLFGRASVTPEREHNYHRLIAELGIEKIVIRLGYVPDSELWRLYSEATLFIFPSVYEGFGLPLVEAMACGTCVVARNASSMAELVGDTGVLVETLSVEDLAAAINALLDNPLRRRQLAEAGRIKAKRFSVERMTRLTYESYLAALRPRSL